MCRKRSRIRLDTPQNRKRRERLRLLRFQPPVPDFAQALERDEFVLTTQGIGV